MVEEQVVLVDAQDNALGLMEKISAHDQGVLHRAFSAFVVRSTAGEVQVLLQLRAATKYHFGGLWTNTCCSHPRRGQTTIDAAHQRLKHELGFDTDLTEKLSFVYRAADPASGLTEHEFDHVFVGRFDGAPTPNPEEVGDWKWVQPNELLADIKSRPASYTPWFKLVVERVILL